MDLLNIYFFSISVVSMDLSMDLIDMYFPNISVVSMDLSMDLIDMYFSNISTIPVDLTSSTCITDSYREPWQRYKMTVFCG